MRLDDALVVEEVGMRFGGLQALDGLSFTLRPGEVTALIGPNGAGKTTAINVISGALRPTTGTITVDGTDQTKWSPERRTQIARTFQIAQIFGGMTVLENVMVGLHHKAGYGFPSALLRTPAVRRADRVARDEARELLDEVGILRLADQEAGTLPLGQERQLEVARALALDPGVILLDEIASGLTATDREAMAALVRQLGERGLAVLLVEHNMRFVKESAEKLVVLNFGQPIYTGTVTEGLADPRVVDAYLGKPHQEEQ
jgi:branched-chain amino acid transport system ATP-binding protein